jgi:hypothetical protein
MSFNLIEWFQLNNLQNQQEQTNELLEQIREQISRSQLTPAERVQEDAAAKLAWEKDKWGRLWRRMW